LVYSFEKFNNDLVNNSRTFISQHGFDPILIQLFENICIIDGYVRSSIHPLNQQIEHLIQNLQLHNQSEIELYSTNLIEIYTICRSVKTLIKLNKKKFNHIEQFSIIINLFSEFYKNLKILYNRWFENIEKNNNTSNTLSSSLIHPIESVSSTSTHSNIQISSEYHNRINVERLQISSSDIRQPISFTRTPEENEEKKFYLFRQILTRLNNLLWSLSKQNLPSYCEMIESTISDIQLLRSNIDLYNDRSIRNARNQILSMRSEYMEKFRYSYLKQQNYKMNRQVRESYASLMKTIKHVLRSLHRYSLQVDKCNIFKESNRSSTNLFAIG
ncbi:unnamed protein product, partial [Rotaria sp. Silwood2]